MEKAELAGHWGEPHGHEPFEYFRESFEEDDDAERGRGVVRGLARFVEDNTVGPLEAGGVVTEAGQGVEEGGDEGRNQPVNLFPNGVWYGVRPRGQGGGGAGQGPRDLLRGKGEEVRRVLNRGKGGGQG